MAAVKTFLELTRALPVVIAQNMLYAQGFEPSAEERAAIIELADSFEAVGLPRRVFVKVCDFDGQRIGSLEFNL